MVEADEESLRYFEEGLDTVNLEKSRTPAKVVGYGEISTIFQVGDDMDTVYKRMPLFHDRAGALEYKRRYREYCGLLERAGLTLPESATAVVEPAGRPVVLYIAQKRLPDDRAAHRLIHHMDRGAYLEMVGGIVKELEKVWDFNEENAPNLETAIDGQLSNWFLVEEGGGTRIYFVDTGTPIFRKDGVEQLDPRLLLRAAPGFLRWPLELLFLKDVMTRYYDRRQVYIDLAANLHKEQRPELIPVTVEAINSVATGGVEPLTEEDVRGYYREDRLIWASFLALRRFDRWVTTRVRRRRYEFVLPGKIKR